MKFASDDFNRADGGLGANWTTITGALVPQIVSNQVQLPSVGGAIGAQALYTAITWPANQYAKCRVITLNTSNGRSAHVILRGTTAARTQYECLVQGPLGATCTLRIDRLVAGALTNLAITGANQTVNSGDVLMGTIVGSTIRLYINDVLKLEASNGTHTSGTPGLVLYSSTGLVTDSQLDDWEGGEAGTTVLTGFGRRHRGFIYT